jgi:ribonuclease P protein component
MIPAASIEHLKKRADFLAAAKAHACGRGAVLVQARDRGDGSAAIRVGFTATRRIGGAVQRNRAKRRLREAARAVAPGRSAWVRLCADRPRRRGRAALAASP